MEFSFTSEQEAWRHEVRGWIRSEFGPDWRGVDRTDDDESFATAHAAHLRLAAKGWSAPAWPVEHGGMGKSFVEQAILNEELAYHRVPGPDIISIGYVGPTLLAYGTAEQQAQHLEGIVQARTYWCQGYSEPGAGSDLAALQTRAVRDGDDYVINGQKIWTSNAHHADWMFILVRTDPDAPKHRGISYLLVDMRTPGIEVRPLINLRGNQDFNEVFLEDVRVPVHNRVGEENRGWYVGMATMDFERSALAGQATIRRNFEDFVGLLRDRPALVTAPVRDGVADLAVGIHVGRMLSLRVLSMQQRGLAPNHEASMARLFTSELDQRFANFGTNVLGLYGQVRSGDARSSLDGWFPENYLQSVSATIAGGTAEIQRGIIATRGLDLPRA